MKRCSPIAKPEVTGRVIEKEEKKVCCLPEISPESSIVVSQRQVLAKWRENELAIGRVFSFVDRTKPSFAQPWRDYQCLLMGDFPNFVKFPLNKVKVAPFSEVFKTEIRESEIDKRMSLLSTWFLPDLSRPLPSMMTNLHHPLSLTDKSETLFLDIDDVH
ncbi:hypothetical protein Ciccas_002500 [Cichlidogyrus casuarinus]|uniref:Uncharacterized protein n=1 Tax=Cichlidogyrus casuarinus TaxID=1844966 RepID=A0ABD2QH04_9PLAT